MTDIRLSADDQRHTAITAPEGNEPHSLEAQDTTPSASTADPAVVTEHDAEQSPPLSRDVPFPFMKLPLELRNQVYEEFLVLPGKRGPKYLRSNIKRARRLRQQKRDAINLFLAPRAIYYEAVPIYYGLKIFHFPNVDNLALFLSELKPRFRRSIRSLSVFFWGKTPARAARLLVKCTGLRNLSLCFNVFPAGCMPKKNRRLMKMHGLEDLLRIRGLETLRLEYVADEGAKDWKSAPIEELDAFRGGYASLQATTRYCAVGETGHEKTIPRLLQRPSLIQVLAKVHARQEPPERS